MNSLNYIGSKRTLSSHIIDIIRNNTPDIQNCSFGDLFAGTGVIGFSISSSVKNVVANDTEYYSYIINCALLKCDFSDKLKKILDECNKLCGVEGLIYQNFSENSERLFFTDENAKKADAMMQHIRQLKVSGSIDTNEFNFLLASLLISIDKVANTASVYGAFLKKFKASALKTLSMQPIHTNIRMKKEVVVSNMVFNEPIEQLITKCSFDVVYLDPPYNQRQYGANYSQLNYIAHYNDNVVPRGKTGLTDYYKSSFCKKSSVYEAMEELITNLEAKYIYVSYNNEGLLTKEQLKDVFMKKGNVILYNIDYRRYKASNKKEASNEAEDEMERDGERDVDVVVEKIKDKNKETTRTVEYLWCIDVKSKSKGFKEVVV